MSSSDQGQHRAEEQGQEEQDQSQGAVPAATSPDSSTYGPPQPVRLFGGLAAAIRNSLGEQELLADICRGLVEEGGCCAAWVEAAALDEHGEPALAAHSPGLKPQPGPPPLLGAYLKSPAAAEIEPGVVLDAAGHAALADWLAHAGRPDCQAVLVLPLGAAATPFGVLGIGSCRGSFAPEAVAAYSDYAGLCTAALEAVRSRSALRRSEYVDAALVRSVLRDEFLAGVSHELRTPLMGILGVSEALQEQVYGPLTERQQRALHSIEQSGLHLLELLNDILDIAKAESGQTRLLLSTIAVDDVCRDSLQMTQQLAQQKSQRLVYTITPPALTMEADARRLTQILVNLLSNAIKFTPVRGELGLEVAGDAGAGVVRFTVWDHGIGIAAEDMPRLFEPFVQLNVGLTRQFTGTGLGLALVKRMAELHGGQVDALSTVGQGSTFVVTLPWRKASRPANGSAAQPEQDDTPAAPPTRSVGRTAA